MSESSEDKIKFDFIKSNFFRSARADGMLCGVNGHGDLILSFYSERSPIPQRTVHRLIDGRLGAEIMQERMGREAVVREVEISISMNLQVARAVRKLLDSHIKLIEARISESTGDLT